MPKYRAPLTLIETFPQQDVDLTRVFADEAVLNTQVSDAAHCRSPMPHISTDGNKRPRSRRPDLGGGWTAREWGWIRSDRVG